MIRVATWSPFGPPGLRLGPSHVAMISDSEQGPVWVESTTLCPHPCLVRGERVSGCQAHEPHLRVGGLRECGGTSRVFRLAPFICWGETSNCVAADPVPPFFVWDPVGYDVGGAILSGTRAMRLARTSAGSGSALAVLLGAGGCPSDAARSLKPRQPDGYSPAACCANWSTSACTSALQHGMPRPNFSAPLSPRERGWG